MLERANMSIKCAHFRRCAAQIAFVEPDFVTGSLFLFQISATLTAERGRSVTMTVNLVESAERIEKEMRGVSGPARDRLVSEFLGVMAQLRQSGARISAHLRSVEHALEEEATESQFDNMPV